MYVRTCMHTYYVHTHASPFKCCCSVRAYLLSLPPDEALEDYMSSRSTRRHTGGPTACDAHCEPLV